MRTRITTPNRPRPARKTLAGLVLAAAALTAGAAPAQADTPEPAEPKPAFTTLLETITTLLVRAAETAKPAPQPTPQPPKPMTAAEKWQIICDADSAVPELVVRRFYCNSRDLGIDHDTAMRVATEALIVANCESRLDPDIIVFDGRYLNQAHPRTGFRYSAAGVFQFIRATADNWIEGGYANATDARKNIDAATRLYWHNVFNGRYGWADWACAAANDGFRHTNVLDERTPAWGHQIVWATVGHLPPHPG